MSTAQASVTEAGPAPAESAASPPQSGESNSENNDAGISNESKNHHQPVNFQGGGGAASTRRVTIGGHTNSSSATTNHDVNTTGEDNKDSTEFAAPSSASKAQAMVQTTGATNHLHSSQHHTYHHPVASVGGYGTGTAMMSGPHNAMADLNRRSSMSSAFGGMDDFFARRSSLGFDMGMDAFFAGPGGRRDSMDSTTAALDAAIMDLSRRRFSTVGGAVADPTPESLSQRQQQLQQQQRELEQRQKELEFQRRQLIASMQERSYQGSYGGGGGFSSMGRNSSAMGHMPTLDRSGSLGFNSVHSQNSSGPAPHRSSHGSGGSGTQWWICQVCNSKAFASHEEAMVHEETCRQEQGFHPSARGMMNRMGDPMNPLPMHTQDSMGYGSLFGGGPMMDTSQRSIGMSGPFENSTRGVVSMGMDSSRGSMGMDSSRTMSLGMDSSSGAHSYDQRTTMSLGPFAMLTQPMALAMESDKDWLTPLHCFVRRHCVEVFTASESDVATPSKGKRKPITVGQVGIRCPHCHRFDSDGNNKARERGSVYYPTTISSIYNATMNLLQRHLHNCTAVPDDVMRRYETLKADDARSGTSKRYWIESALSLGLVDTPTGIRHSALLPPPLPTLTRQQETTGQNTARRNSNEFFSTKSNAVAEIKESPSNTSSIKGTEGNAKEEEADEEVDVGEETNSGMSKMENSIAETAPLVTPDDKPYATTFSYQLLSQMQPCVFTEADRLGKRKGLPPGFPGLACRHCFGGYGSGRFFPSSIKTLSDTSKTLNVLHNHMMRCRKCPADVKDTLEKLRNTHDEERAKMKFGSQKAFFARIWSVLHGADHPGSYKKPKSQPRPQIQQQAPNYHHQQHVQQRMMHSPPIYGMQHPQMHPHHGYGGTHPRSGLDALAAVSSPSKRQKLN